MTYPMFLKKGAGLGKQHTKAPAQRKKDRADGRLRADRRLLADHHSVTE